MQTGQGGRRSRQKNLTEIVFRIFVKMTLCHAMAYTVRRSHSLWLYLLRISFQYFCLFLTLSVVPLSCGICIREISIDEFGRTVTFHSPKTDNITFQLNTFWHRRLIRCGSSQTPNRHSSFSNIEIDPTPAARVWVFTSRFSGVDRTSHTFRSNKHILTNYSIRMNWDWVHLVAIPLFSSRKMIPKWSAFARVQCISVFAEFHFLSLQLNSVKLLAIAAAKWPPGSLLSLYVIISICGPWHVERNKRDRGEFNWQQCCMR